jgi:pimeloyl-ACP methyl ester carboxylesterase
MNPETSTYQAALPQGIRSRLIPNGNGLLMHVLEAGEPEQGRPCLVLLHGFPELAYSWRKLMLPLAAAGFYVVAPDQRGYGRSTGWDGAYAADLAPFRVLNLVRDTLGLVSALGYRSVAAVIGHDFGAPVAAWCALVRGDVFRSVVLMSAPFPGPPELPAPSPALAAAAPNIQAELATLAPPRKHYHWYYSTPDADADMRDCPQGIHAFLRAYYHVKSADWAGNAPYRLAAWSAGELAKLPTYYVMRLQQNMAETVAGEMPTPAAIAACSWLSEAELSVYSSEFQRTGFQGGLNWYRCRTSGRFEAEQQVFAGRSIDVPALFIAGKNDWGAWQVPGALDKMQSSACAHFLGCHFVDGAGHWVQQEQPAAVLALLTGFLRETATQRA